MDNGVGIIGRCFFCQGGVDFIANFSVDTVLFDVFVHNGIHGNLFFQQFIPTHHFLVCHESFDKNVMIYGVGGGDDTHAQMVCHIGLDIGISSVCTGRGEVDGFNESVFSVHPGFFQPF